jgi:hypothetical protein
MNLEELFSNIYQEHNRRAYIQRVQILNHSQNLLKARLYISNELFVQIYRNTRFNTTNLILIYNNERIYARDQLGDNWHRHSSDNPEQHDTSPDGRRVVELSEFLDEVENILTELELP